jgi:hypothetical protein
VLVVVLMMGGEWVPELCEVSMGGVCEELGRKSTREAMEFKMSGP